MVDHALLLLAERKVGHLNIKTEMFDFEARVLIGRLVKLNTQNACLKVKHLCLYKVACLSYGEYIICTLLHNIYDHLDFLFHIYTDNFANFMS